MAQNTAVLGEAHDEEVKGSSNRGFGLVFASVFCIVGLWPLTVEGGQMRMWSLGVAVVFLLVSLIAPNILAPANRLWTAFGLLLHKIVNPIIMALIFFVAVTPTALIFRMLGKDPLRMRLDKAATSYWIHRTPPGPAPDSMPHQF